jgi:putative oxidoreductase
MKAGNPEKLMEKSKYRAFLAFASHPATLAFFKVLMGALFVISSITKISDPASFVDSIANYKILPKTLLMPMAIVVPWIQMLAGVMLVLDIYAQSSAFIVSGLLVVYIIAITSAYVRGIDIDCGCFDLLSHLGLEDKVGIKAILRDLGFLVATGWVFLFDKNILNFYGIGKLFKK